MWRRVLRPPSDLESRIEKARDRFPGAGFKNLATMKICR
jgi:hypothetical protein